MQVLYDWDQFVVPLQKLWNIESYMRCWTEQRKRNCFYESWFQQKLPYVDVDVVCAALDPYGSHGAPAPCIKEKEVHVKPKIREMVAKGCCISNLVKVRPSVKPQNWKVQRSSQLEDVSLFFGESVGVASKQSKIIHRVSRCVHTHTHTISWSDTCANKNWKTHWKIIKIPSDAILLGSELKRDSYEGLYTDPPNRRGDWFFLTPLSADPLIWIMW